jgi:hypothetical protein
MVPNGARIAHCCPSVAPIADPGKSANDINERQPVPNRLASSGLAFDRRATQLPACRTNAWAGLPRTPAVAPKRGMGPLLELGPGADGRTALLDRVPAEIFLCLSPFTHQPRKFVSKKSRNKIVLVLLPRSFDLVLIADALVY